MDVFLFALIAFNLVLFAGLCALAVARARYESSVALRKVSWILAATAGAFAIGAGQRLIVHAIQAGWIGGDVGEFFTTQWQLVQSLCASALGIGAVVAWRRLWASLRHGESVARILAVNLPDGRSIDDFGLTRREREIADAISTGCMTDAELADRFFISPATARTHVRNILRKTGVTNRRDLMVLVGRSNEGRYPAGGRRDTSVE